MMPRFRAQGPRHCPLCGDDLDETCPSCQAPLEQGYFCPECGAAYIDAPPKLEGDQATEEAAAKIRLARLRLTPAMPWDSPLRLVAGAE